MHTVQMGDTHKTEELLNRLSLVVTAALAIAWDEFEEPSKSCGVGRDLIDFVIWKPQKIWLMS